VPQDDLLFMAVGYERKRFMQWTFGLPDNSLQHRKIYVGEPLQGTLKVRSSTWG